MKRAGFGMRGSTMMMLQRVVAAAVAALLGLGLEPSSAQDKRFDGVTLRVATWGAAWKDVQEKIIAKKFSELGGKIEYVTGSPQANLAKLIAARGQLPFDLMEILDAQVPDMEKSDLLEPIDADKVSNKSLIEPFQLQKSLIGTWYTQEGICYNKPKYAELGLTPPKSFQDLVNPKLERKVLLPDINSGGGLAFVGAIAHATGGDEKNIKPGLELINRIKPPKYWSQGAELITQMKSGDIIAAVAHSGWCHRAALAGATVAFSHPEIKAGIKGIAKEGWFGILKGTKNKEAALWYVNAFLDPAFQKEFAAVAGVLPISKPALAGVKDVPIMKDMVETDAAAIKAELRIDYRKVDLSGWNDLWNRTVAR